MLADTCIKIVLSISSITLSTSSSMTSSTFKLVHSSLRRLLKSKSWKGVYLFHLTANMDTSHVYYTHIHFYKSQVVYEFNLSNSSFRAHNRSTPNPSCRTCRPPAIVTGRSETNRSENASKTDQQFAFIPTRFYHSYSPYNLQFHL